jgi:hypothetical protein
MSVATKSVGTGTLAGGLDASVGQSMIVVSPPEEDADPLELLRPPALAAPAPPASGVPSGGEDELEHPESARPETTRQAAAAKRGQTSIL